MSTPVTELRQAAAKLRQTAAKATPGPWEDHSTGDGPWPVLVAGGPVPGDPAGYRDTVIKVHESVREDILAVADAAWIALAGPQIAEPLADLLEAFALVAPVLNTDKALAIARAINGKEARNGA
jgi:hypothetical protein